MRSLIVFMCLILPLAATAGEYTSAKKLGSPNTKVMGCPDGSFWDPRNGGECWSCGEGKRTANPVDSARACLVTPKTSFAPAKRLEANKNTCGAGSFLDIGKGTCWSCPAGTKRTAYAVDSDKACSKRIKKKKRKADYVYKTGSLLKACRKGTFANAGSQSCYSCPKGWKHDPTKKVKTNGVCFKPAKTDHFKATEGEDFSLSCKSGFYDPIDKGSCWTCPKGYVRQVTSVKSDKACMAVSAPRSTAARLIKAHSPRVVDIADGVTKLGCRAHGNSAFFDLIDGGTCWSCPSSHPQRTLYAVNKDRACATRTCGAENGRPCFVWERIPSCNRGLIENPISNQCVRPANLACKAYVNTLAGFRKTIEEADRLSGAAQEEALKKVPGGEAMINFVLNQYTQAQAQLDKMTPKIDTSEIDEQLQTLLTADPEFVRNLVRTVRIVVEQQSRFIDFMTDPDQICSGDIDRLVANLKGQGLHDAFRDTRSAPSGPTRIQMGQAGGPFSSAAMLGPSLAYANLAAVREQIGPIVGPGSRNRLVIDLTFDFPVQKIPEGEFSAGLQVAIPLGDQAQPGVYLMLGGYSGIDKSAKGIDDFTKGGFGTMNLGVGFQWGGLKRHADHSCMNSSLMASVGAAIKAGGIMGFGLNPTCGVTGAPANLFSGFGFSIGGVNLGKLEPLLTQVEFIASPDGSVRAVHKMQDRFVFASTAKALKFGPEVSVQLLPLPDFKTGYRVGAPM